MLFRSIARGALDDLRQLGLAKRARGARTTLRESPVFHTDLARLEAKWRAAKALQQQTLATVWGEVLETGELTLAQRGDLRLATTHAIREATDVVGEVYRLAGSTAIFENQPFERRFRDAHAVSQQVQGRHTNYETVGRLMMDLEPDMMFL